MGKHVAVFTLFLFSMFFWPEDVSALEPEEVLVLVNQNEREGLKLAEYYLERRGIPPENLLKLRVTTKEKCSRKEYQERVAAPVRERLAQDKYSHIRCILTFYGMPLKIAPPRSSAAEVNALKTLRAKRDDLKKEKESATPGQDKEIQEEIRAINTRIRKLRFSVDRASSLDSELSLVKTVGYNLGMWVRNPYYQNLQNTLTFLQKKDVVMTARLDGPDSSSVKRIIDDTLSAEKDGLSGTACFDARWESSRDPRKSDYIRYDHSIHKAYRIVAANSDLKLIIDDTKDLFQQGDCPNSALYVGWYSLGKYVDGFDWQPGSVGYHIASSECVTLKKEDSQVWCKKMIEEGVAATIGPVGEPYLQAFPPPELFFDNLLGKKLQLVEAYFQSLPHLSWKMVLIGDPLYRLNIEKM